VSGFSTLAAALGATGLTETVFSLDEACIFAPTDDAFAALLSELGLDAPALLADTDLVTGVLTHHVHLGACEDGPLLMLNDQDATLAGDTVTSAGGTEATVSETTAVCDSGITVKVVDAVLMPDAEA